MKKGIFFLVILSLFVGFSAFAAETDISATETLNVASPTVLPGSPFYFLKEVGRNIQTALTMDPVKKAELKLKFANEKLAEADKVSEAGDSASISKALDNYEKGIEDMKQFVDVLKKDNPNNQTLLQGLVDNSVNHQQILDKIAERNKEVQVKTEEIKERAVGTLANGTLELASAEKVKEKIEKAVEDNADTASEKAIMLENIVQKLPDEAKKALVAVQNAVISNAINTATEEEKEKLEQSLNRLKESNQYKELKIEEIAKEIVSGGDDIINNLDISETDMAKLKEFAQNIIADGSINYGRAISGINTLNISTDTQKKITDFIKEEVFGNKVPEATQQAQQSATTNKAGIANPASTFCVKNGYKLEIRKNADGSEYGVCIFTDGKECEEWKFYRKECGKEYIK